MIRYDTLKVGSRVASNTRKHPNTQCSTMYYLVVHRFRLETDGMSMSRRGRLLAERHPGGVAVAY